MNIFQAASVCVFDAYGTLLDIGAMTERFRPDLGDAAEPFFRKWRRRQLEISWLPNPIMAGADFWMITGEALDEVMAEFGLRDHRLRSRLMDAWLAPRLYPDVVPALKRLRGQGMKTAILSNGTRAMLEAGLKAVGITALFDAVLSVEQVRVFKPNAAVYGLVTRHFDTAPASVCFVSGNPWDIQGAAVFGFRTIWLNRAADSPENLPRGTLATITTLAELPALLGA